VIGISERVRKVDDGFDLNFHQQWSARIRRNEKARKADGLVLQMGRLRKAVIGETDIVFGEDGPK
jgi:hypothetical protein